MKYQIKFLNKNEIPFLQFFSRNFFHRSFILKVRSVQIQKIKDAEPVFQRY